MSHFHGTLKGNRGEATRDGDLHPLVRGELGEKRSVKCLTTT